MATALFERSRDQGHRLAVQDLRGRRARLQCDASGVWAKWSVASEARFEARKIAMRRNLI